MASCATFRLVPRKLDTSGDDPNALVTFQMKMPLWLKRRGMERARALAKDDLATYLRDLMVADIGARDEPTVKPSPRPKRGKGSR